MPSATATNATYARGSSATRSITYTLTNCTKSNATESVTYYATATVTKNGVNANITIPSITATSITGSATITADTGYHLDSITAQQTNCLASLNTSTGALSIADISGNATVVIAAGINRSTIKLGSVLRVGKVYYGTSASSQTT